MAEDHGWVRVLRYVADECAAGRLPDRALVVAAQYLLRYRDHRTGQCNPSIERVVRDTGIRRATLVRGRADLIAAGVMTVGEHAQHSTPWLYWHLPASVLTGEQSGGPDCSPVASDCSSVDPDCSLVIGRLLTGEPLSRSMIQIHDPDPGSERGSTSTTTAEPPASACPPPSIESDSRTRDQGPGTSDEREGYYVALREAIEHAAQSAAIWGVVRSWPWIHTLDSHGLDAVYCGPLYVGDLDPWAQHVRTRRAELARDHRRYTAAFGLADLRDRLGELANEHSRRESDRDRAARQQDELSAAHARNRERYGALLQEIEDLGEPEMQGDVDELEALQSDASALMAIIEHQAAALQRASARNLDRRSIWTDQAAAIRAGRTYTDEGR